MVFKCALKFGGNEVLVNAAIYSFSKHTGTSRQHGEMDLNTVFQVLLLFLLGIRELRKVNMY